MYGVWRTLHVGATLGRDWSQSFRPLAARRFRLQILDATNGPTLEESELREK